MLVRIGVSFGLGSNLLYVNSVYVGQFHDGQVDALETELGRGYS